MRIATPSDLIAQAIGKLMRIALKTSEDERTTPMHIATNGGLTAEPTKNNQKFHEMNFLKKIY